MEDKAFLKLIGDLTTVSNLQKNQILNTSSNDYINIEEISFITSINRTLFTTDSRKKSCELIV